MNKAEAIQVVEDTVYKAKLDPDWFASDILFMPNDPFQSELLNAVADLDRIRLGLPTKYNHKGLNRFTVRSCHGTGKTHTLAKLMHWFNFTRKARIPCTAPKERQVITRVWPEFRKIRSRAPREYRALMKVDKTMITWVGDPDWCALVEAASQSENLSGLHDDYLMFLVEEASGIDQSMIPAIEGSLSTTNSVLVLIGNPTRTEGEFYCSHRKPGTMELYYKMHVKPEDSPRVSEKWLTNMRRKYGEKSPIYLVRCLGEFADMGERQLIAMSWIEDARNAIAKPDGTVPTKRLSADIADGGGDETVITIATHFLNYVYMKRQFVYSFPSSEAPILAAQEIERLVKKYNFNFGYGDDIVVDALGVGAGTAGYLIQKDYPVITYKGGEASDNNKEWLNRRTQSYIAMRDAFRDKKIIFADEFYEKQEGRESIDVSEDWDDLIGQITSIKTNKAVEKVEALEPKRMLPKSPDRADSLAMQFATQQPYISGQQESEVLLTGQSELQNYDANVAY